MSNTIYQLKKDLEQEMREMGLDNLDQDTLSELADSWIPIHYSDLAHCLAEDTSLSELEDSGLAEGITDIFKRIQMAIYEQLIQHAYRVYAELEAAKAVA